MMLGRLPLTVGMIGSSVAAGHDNCAYDSFENQLERTMKDAFAAVGYVWSRDIFQNQSFGFEPLKMRRIAVS